MTADGTPKGEEREVERAGGVTIDGAPIAYIIVWAAIVFGLSFVPLPISVVLGIGGTFPLSQTVYPVLGFILGPWAGALAAGIGRLIGVFSAPHTSTVGILSTIVAMATAAAGGLLVENKGRTWLLAPIVFVLAFVFYIASGLGSGVALGLALLSTAVNWIGILLWLLPTRMLARHWIASQSAARLAAGLVLGSWIVNTSSYIVPNALFYPIFKWPPAQWAMLAGVAPVEHLFRTLAGAVIGVGVITGLRAIGLVKPTRAGY
ncbi:MAG TPA: hypothetical protein VMY98_00210 [Anaerolineae bacterium]|nr:hypothetical protein [Anaerolineae bacterium]